MKYFLEKVTKENLDEAAYLAANSDVAAAKMSARLHFEKHGQFEGRKQLIAGLSASDWSARYARFRHILQSPYGDDPNGSFPIVAGISHHDVTTYAHESANSGNGIFDDEVIKNPSKLYLDLGCGLRERVFDNCMYVEVYNARCADLIVEPRLSLPDPRRLAGWYRLLRGIGAHSPPLGRGE